MTPIQKAIESVGTRLRAAQESIVAAKADAARRADNIVKNPNDAAFEAQLIASAIRLMEDSKLMADLLNEIKSDLNYFYRAALVEKGN